MNIKENKNDAKDHTIYIYGMKFPNRIFVGGLPKTAEAMDIAKYFDRYGVVTEAKIILKDNGKSKGYGFVTFSVPEEAENVLKQQQLYYQGQKLNLGPAVRKQTPEVMGETVVIISTNNQNSGTLSITN